MIFTQGLRKSYFDWMDGLATLNHTIGALYLGSVETVASTIPKEKLGFLGRHLKE